MAKKEVNKSQAIRDYRPAPTRMNKHQTHFMISEKEA